MTLNPKLSKSGEKIRNLISDLYEAEFVRDLDKSEKLFSFCWENIEETPDFSRFAISDQAELLRLAGVFLSELGKAKNKTEFQADGRYLLNLAKEIYDSVQNEYKLLECDLLIAVTYNFEGNMQEYENRLDKLISRFPESANHPIYLQAQICRSTIELILNEFDAASKRLDKISARVIHSTNVKLKILFFCQLGILYRNLKKFEDAHCSFKIALENAEFIQNIYYQSLILNSLANSFRDAKSWELSLAYVNEALLLGYENKGWTAIFLDTKANIYYDIGDYEKALVYASESVALVSQGDDYKAVVESLWTKILILFKLGDNEEAINAFFELREIAFTRIGENITKIYQDKFVSNTFFCDDLDLNESLDLFQKSRIENALRKSGGKVTKAARILGLSQQTLSSKLKKYPSMRSDFGLSRKPRKDAKCSV